MERRRLLDLPSEYTLIPHIYSGGRGGVDGNVAPRIETNIYADENTEIGFDFEDKSIVIGNNYCGVRNPNLAIVTFGSAVKIGSLVYNNPNIQAIPYDNNRHMYILGDGKLKIDGVSYGTLTKYSFTSVVPITFFMSNGNTAGGSGWYMAAASGYGYYAYIKKNGVMLFEGYPCRRNSDGRIGMYDTVSGQPFFAEYGIEFTENP